jgi:hypothetical protein
MIPWMTGEMTARGNVVDVDAGPGDIFDNLQFGAMGYLEVSQGKWGFGLDALYMALGTTSEKPPANVDPDEAAFTFMGMRELGPNLDLVFGARWNYLKAKIDFKEPIGIVVEDTKNWVDPIVGIQFEKSLGYCWHFRFQGDIGGFGAGSDLTWHLFPVISFDVGERARLGFGYRMLGFDYISGTGSELFEYEMIVSGLVLGSSFHF